MKHRLSAIALLLVATLPSLAQSPAQTPAATPPPAVLSQPVPPQPVGSIAGHPGWPQPKPADVSSPDAILAAVYDVISGPAGQPRDWDRMRSLFLPDARLIPATILPGSPDAASPNTDAIILTIDGYIARSRARTATVGFFEHSIHNEVEQYGNIVQIWSTYESRHTLADPMPFARGINSFQFLKDGNRYWVVNIFWGAETPTTPIPTKYLPSAASPSTSINSNFNGDWVGQLEYRDFQSNQQVFLPTWLTLNPDPDGNSVKIAYTYDDGPTKTVRESSTLTFQPGTQKATLTSDTDHTSEAFEVQGLAEFTKLNRGTLVLTGKGKENDHPVDVRLTLTLRRNLYTLRKETRPAGEEFKFRDGYTFTRAEAPRT
ncbi:hypothetical protein [Granulicella arctica]|uniref:hypothetical protein n=1 Tax=Granulicella arctica TaxID=940613 RepID=UPI0021DFDA5B|nr:hypothetical protein [Granulicella arctica]